MRYTHYFAAIMLLLCAPFAQANEQDLYEAAPPADAGFVRLINATMDGAQTLQVGNVKLEAGAKNISAYHVLKNGKYSAVAGELSAEIELAAGEYMTLIMQDNAGALAIRPVKDKAIKSPSKAMIYFYNLSDSSEVVLHAANHKVDIFSAVEAGSETSREINPLEIDVAIKHGEKVIGSFDGTNLKRRRGVSFVLAGSGDAMTAFHTENSIAPIK